MELLLIHDWEPFQWEHVRVYRAGDLEFTNFSEGLKSNVLEWLELFSDDVIYFDHEIKLLKKSEMSKLGMVRMHNKKKHLQDEYVKSETGRAFF